MDIPKIPLAVGLAGLSLSLSGFVISVAYSTYRISGEVREVRITPSGRGKEWHPDWMIVPGFHSGNYRDVPSYAILRVEHDEKIDEYVMYLGDDPKIPAIDERVELEVKRLGVYKPLTGEEPTFSDGVLDLNHSRSYPAITRVISLR